LPNSPKPALSLIADPRIMCPANLALSVGSSICNLQNSTPQREDFHHTYKNTLGPAVYLDLAFKANTN